MRCRPHECSRRSHSDRKKGFFLASAPVNENSRARESFIGADAKKKLFSGQNAIGERTFRGERHLYDRSDPETCLNQQ